MEPTTFTPELGDLYTTLVVCGLLIALMVFLAVRAGKRSEPDPRRRVLLPMLAYFGGLLALMALLGAFWSILKFPVVTITPTELVLGEETYPRPSLANVRIQGDDVLLIQTRDRKKWAFPGDRYDVRRMYGMLRGQ